MAKLTAKNLAKSLLTTIALLCSLGISAKAQQPGKIQWGDSAYGERNPFGLQEQKLSYLDNNGTPIQPSKSFMEILRGNGTRAGYMLSHGGVVPSSVRISVGAHTLRANQDYFLDASNGSLFFAEPIRRGDTVSAYYRYVEGQDASRSPLGVPGLALNFKGTALNFGYGVSNFNGLDFTTYGLNMASSLGGGSTLNGLIYFSTPAGNSNNVVGPNATHLNTASSAKPEDAQNDHLIVQNLNVKSGSATFRATYQDVGSHFNGFQAMRMNNASNQDVMAQINALEKEKGVQRLGFGAGLQLSKNSNFGLNWDTIKDGSGDIQRQGLNYKGGALNFSYNTQSVSSKFAKFQGLREGEAAQWAREKGMKRSDMSLGFAPGKGSQLGFTMDQVGDAAGSLTRQGFNFNSKSLNFNYGTRKADASFARINNLTDAEKTALALDIHRQFNPNAQAGEVTAKDKEQIALDAGLNRSQLGFNTTLGKKGAFGFNQFSIGDDKGSISRRSFNFSDGKLAFNYMDQNISEGFNRLSRMSDFEKAQFGNEAGIHRSAMGLNLALGKGSAFGFNQLSIGDNGGGMTRQSFTYGAKGLDFKLKMSDTASTFARARDLAGMSDVEKAGIEAERGYKRMDMAANLALTKSSSFAFSQLSLTGTDGNVSRQSFAYAAKGLDLHFNLADTAKNFARARNLIGLTDAEKNSIESERGFKRMDYSANINTIKGLALSTYVYNATNAAEGLGRSNFRHSLVWDASKVTHISFLTEGNANSTDGRTMDGRNHQLLTFDHKLGRGMLFNFYRDTVADVAGGKDVPTVATDFLHFETDRSKVNNLMAQTKRIDFGNGKKEDTTELDMNYRAMKTMSLHFNRLSIDRGADPSIDTNTMQWAWQTSKTLGFSGTFSNSTTNNKQDRSTQIFNVDGMITKTLKFNGNFSQTISQDKSLENGSKGFSLSGVVTRDLNFSVTTAERNQAGKSLGYAHELAISNSKPMNVLGLKNVTFTGKYTAGDDRQKNQMTEIVSGKIEGMLGTNKMGMEYGGSLDAKNNDSFARSFYFISDPNQKKALHVELFYKARNINRGDLELVRSYKVSYRIDKVTNLAYNYSSMPEDGAGNMQPVKSSDFSLNRQIRKDMSFSLSYVTAKNFQQKNRSNKLMAVMKGKADRLSNVQVGYSIDLSTQNGQSTDAHTVTFAYDRQIDGDHYITLSTSYTMGKGATQNDLVTNVDFKTIF